MKSARYIFSVCLSLFLFSTPSFSKAVPDSFADTAESLLPAVVNISTTQLVNQKDLFEGFRFPPGSPFEDFFKYFMGPPRSDFYEKNPPSQRRSMALGSGFIISKDGYVVTNAHVIRDADEISVILQDGSDLKAKLVGRDSKTDIALLKINRSKPFAFVQWGNSDKARVGEWVLAIGNPFGFGGTVTAGIISARNRNIEAGPYDDFIQTDASINKGNSGGPLFSLDGRVIGINTAIYSPSGGSIGIGFAVPSVSAIPVIEQLKKYGRTRRGWLGVTIQPINKDIAEGLGLKKPQGALVASVADKSPAQKAGVLQGDVILTFAGQIIENMRSLPRIVADTKIGSRVVMKVWRNKKQIHLMVDVGELDEGEEDLIKEKKSSKKAPVDDSNWTAQGLGLVLSDITASHRKKFKLDEKAIGVIIVDVDNHSSAWEKGVRLGDTILEINHQNVKNLSDFKKKFLAMKKSSQATVLLLIDTPRGPRYFGLRFGE